jgi:hypothetical protein
LKLNVWAAFLPLQPPVVPNPDSDKSTQDELLMQKAVFVACQAGLLALAIYKVHTMGLLPTHESDWFVSKFMLANDLIGYQVSVANCSDGEPSLA